MRCFAATASGRRLPARICAMHGRRIVDHAVDLTGDQVGDRGAAPRYGTCVIFTSAACMKIASPRWPVVPMPGEPKLSLPRLRARQRDEVLQRLGFDLRMHDEQHRHIGDVGDGNERGLGVERHLGVEELIGCEDAGRRHQQRVAVGRRLRDRVGADIAAGARAVFHDDRLAERLRHLVADRARQHVGEPAGRERRDHADRTVGIILRQRRAGVAPDAAAFQSRHGDALQ